LIISSRIQNVNRILSEKAKLKEVTLKAEKAETVFLLYFFIQSGERRLAKWTDIRI